MNPFDFFNQDEACAYLRRAHGILIVPGEMSVLCKFGRGPNVLGRKGRMMVIAESDLDHFAAEQKKIDLESGEAQSDA